MTALQSFGKGLNFSMTNKSPSVLDLISSVDLGILQLSENEQNDVHCRVNMTLQKPSNIRPNISFEE